MKTLFLLTMLLWTSSAMSKTINIEFNFTPFLGNPATAKQVQTVEGKAQVFLNNVLVAEQEVDQHEVPVLFEDKEVGTAVWIRVQSLGSVVRRGKNTLKIEFEPADRKVEYHVRLSWAEVKDQSSEEFTDGVYKATNQAGEGQENKDIQGKAVLEKDFVADFVPDLVWHHYPPTTDLDEADKQQLLKLVNDRAALFQPKFAGLYQLLEAIPHPGWEFNPSKLRAGKCPDKAYAAGIRIPVQTAANLDFILTGNPEVVIKGKAASLYPFDQQKFAKIKDKNKAKTEETQLCAAMILSAIYPPQLVVVKNPAGVWEIVY